MTRILTLSGWAQSPDALRRICPEGAKIEVLDYSEYEDISALSVALAGQVYDLIVGWSLGGHVALRLVGQGVLKAQRLVILCAPHQFVREENSTIPYGMERWLFQQFYENYTSNPQRTAKRFAGLIAKGDMRMKEVIREMLPHESVYEVNRWARWLALLGESQLKASDLPDIPALLIHGEEDALVKPEQSKWLLKHLPRARLQLLESCAHAPHLHDVVAVRKMVQEWCNG